MEGLCLSLLPAQGRSRRAGLQWALEVTQVGEEEDVLRSLRMRPISKDFYTIPKMSRVMTASLG